MKTDLWSATRRAIREATRDFFEPLTALKLRLTAAAKSCANRIRGKS